MTETVKRELLDLTKVEMDILTNGKMNCVSDKILVEDDESQKRLEANNFYDIQKKYRFGFTIGMYDIKTQLEWIRNFKDFIVKYN